MKTLFDNTRFTKAYAELMAFADLMDSDPAVLAIMGDFCESMAESSMLDESASACRVVSEFRDGDWILWMEPSERMTDTIAALKAHCGKV